MNQVYTGKLLKSLISFNPGIYILNVFFWSLFIFSPLATGLLTKQIFDSIERSNVSFSYLWGLIAIWGGFVLLRSFLYFLASISHIYLDYYSTGLLRRNLFVQTLRSVSRLNVPGSLGEILNHFRDDVNICARLVGNSMLIPGCILFSMISFATLYSINNLVAIWVFTPLVIITISLNILKVKLQEYRSQNRQATSEVSGFIGEIFGSIQTIILGSAEERVAAKLKDLSNNRRKKIIKDVLLSKLIETFFSNINLIGTGILIIVAAEGLKNGSFSIGDFVIFTYLLPFITEVIDTIGLFLARAKITSVSLQRISKLLPQASPKEILAHYPLSPEKHQDVAGHLNSSLETLETLSLKNISYRYPNSQNGVSNINLDVKRGQTVVITGRTGAGKTTLLKVIIGALKFKQGFYYWNSRPIKNQIMELGAPNIAYSPQTPVLFNGTLKENILLGIGDKHLDRSLDLAVLKEDIVKMPDQMNTVIGSKGVKLSGGQIQRTSLARMFARNADLLVVDDVSSAIDSHTEIELWENLSKLDKTIIVASQNKEAFRKADKIIVLKEGKIAAEGGLEELLSSSEEMQYLWGVNQQKQ